MCNIFPLGDNSIECSDVWRQYPCNVYCALWHNWERKLSWCGSNSLVECRTLHLHYIKACICSQEISTVSFNMTLNVWTLICIMYVVAGDKLMWIHYLECIYVQSTVLHIPHYHDSHFICMCVCINKEVVSSVRFRLEFGVWMVECLSDFVVVVVVISCHFKIFQTWHVFLVHA